VFAFVLTLVSLGVGAWLLREDKDLAGLVSPAGVRGRARTHPGPLPDTFCPIPTLASPERLVRL
jgi:hypothetical protein